MSRLIVDVDRHALPLKKWKKDPDLAAQALAFLNSPAGVALEEAVVFLLTGPADSVDGESAEARTARVVEKYHRSIGVRDAFMTARALADPSRVVEPESLPPQWSRDQDPDQTE